MDLFNSQMNVFDNSLQTQQTIKNLDQLLLPAEESSLQMKNELLYKKNRKTCSVCGQSANGQYYGAVACEGCKIFFRRSVIQNTFSGYECKTQTNECDVEYDRNACKFCRFNKCKRVGMKENSVNQLPRTRTKINNSMTKYCPQYNNRLNCCEFKSFAQNSTQMMNTSETQMDFTPETINPVINENSNLNDILNAFQSTLGKQAIIGDNELILLQLEENEKVREKYRHCIKEVDDFAHRLNILSSLPQNELESSLIENWFDVLLIRSFWWFSQKKVEENLELIRVNGKYGLNITQNTKLKPIFSFAQTVRDMKVTEAEVALIITYILLCGPFAFFSNPKNPNEKTETNKRQEEVINLLSNYQKTTFPEDKLRFVSLIINLTELVFISRLC